MGVCSKRFFFVDFFKRWTISPCVYAEPSKCLEAKADEQWRCPKDPETCSVGPHSPSAAAPRDPPPASLPQGNTCLLGPSPPLFPLLTRTLLRVPMLFVLYSQWTPHNFTWQNLLIIYTLCPRIPPHDPDISLLFWQENTHQRRFDRFPLGDHTPKSGTSIMSYKSSDPHTPTRLQYLLMKHPRMSSYPTKHVIRSGMLCLKQ